jgi:hypothetical protein
MKKTAYELTRDVLAPGMPAARRVLATAPDAEKLLMDLFQLALKGSPLEHDGLLATVPYALAEKAAASVKDPYVWDDFGSSEPMQVLANFDLTLGRAVHRTNEALNTSWVSASIINLWQFQCHRLAGERVYELSLGLAERLLKTELRGLGTDDLRLPFQNVYLVIPAELGLKLMNEKTGEHDLEGVYITEYMRKGMRRWKLLFWGPPNAQSEHEFDDTIFHFSVELPAEATLDKALDDSELFRGSIYNPGTPAAKAYYLDQWRRLFQLVMNAVVYCTWPDAELREVRNAEFLRLQEQLRKHPKGSHKYERTREKLRETPQQRRVVLGPSVTRLETLASQGGASPLVRTLVSGHWQRFAYGPGKMQRKWGWREPFWRGPEEGPESNPRRVLENADG